MAHGLRPRYRAYLDWIELDAGDGVFAPFERVDRLGPRLGPYVDDIPGGGKHVGGPVVVDAGEGRRVHYGERLLVLQGHLREELVEPLNLDRLVVPDGDDALVDG